MLLFDPYREAFKFVIARSSCDEAIQAVLAASALLRFRPALRADLGSQ
jgi:hypothetical protein